ncbi:ATP-binding protein [Thermasporomyces composti]|jgi:DNA polymerase III delta prime subunit|uniref:AAA domain-containing protein n=1 Tax=Thermasporomyces composti TaxID=696763 RepID=A0A3D9V686_THECX|nr:ATP-binding protein [Thermasporomyces composti]REF36213.1 AAA domain-containing protein [Thermasporomyces composti]
MAVDPVPFLLISGPPGVGKTTVGWEIFDQVVDEGHRAALVDPDLIGVCWPAQRTTPTNERLKARNLEAMWRNYRDAGARCLIAAGEIENRDRFAAYVDAIPGAVPTLCRLTARHDELRRRIVTRGRERGEEIEKLYERAVYLSRALAENDVTNFWVETDDRGIADVAKLVRARAGGWPATLL